MEVKYFENLFNQQQVEETCYDNLSKEESIEAIHSNNLSKEELVEAIHFSKPFQSNIRDLATNNLTEKKSDSDLFELELVQLGDNDLLMRQLVENQLVTPNCARSNDISVNLITSVNFLGTICHKSCIVLQMLPLSTFQLQYKKSSCCLECLFIFSLQISLYSLLHENEAMSALD